MQQSSGKLDTIKNIKESLGKVFGLLEKVRDTKAELEHAVSSLRFSVRGITASREEQARRAEKELQFADLKKQREQERRDAEEKIDQITDAFRQKEEARKQATTKAQDAGKADTGATEAVDPITPTLVSPKQVERAHPQNRFGDRPAPGQGRFERPALGHQTRLGDRQGTQTHNRFAAKPNARPPYQAQGQGRTWTPSQSTGGYVRNFGDRAGAPGARPPFTPRQPGTGPQRPGGLLPKPTMATSSLAGKINTFDARKKGKFDGEKSGGMDRRALLRRGIIEERDIEDRMLTRVFRTKKAKDGARDAEPRPTSNVIKVTTNTITVKALSEKIGKTATEIIKQLIILGEMCSINSIIDFATAELVAGEFGLVLELHADKTYEEKMSHIHKSTDDEKEMVTRPPVVTVLGHVDHGKTSLLDALRKTKVTAGEAGGITQHIGAYQVSVKGKKITFFDTPGHAAFDKMRARGAKVTDIAILLVAADDGVMPQTIEAIKHIQSQNLPMIVAMNKIDKKEADVEKVKTQLSQHNVIPEDWGGDAIIVPISATANIGLDNLLEMIITVAEMNNYRANPNKEARGSIIEAQLDKARGPVVTVLVQSGTLKVGDTLLAGTTYGKVRSMMDEKGKSLKRATPGTPVQVLGFQSVPKAGDSAYVVGEKLTKQVVEERKDKEKRGKTKQLSTTAAEDAFDAMHEAEKTHLNIIVKGDVAGSVEAIIQTLRTITSDEVSVHVIGSGVGAVNDNDVALAEMSDARLIAFQTKITPSAATIAKKAKVKIHEFRIIYEIFDFVTREMVKQFKPKFVDKYVGRAEVRAVFKSSQVGLIAGCMVVDGKVVRGLKVKLLRGGEVVGEHKLDTLKIKQNDVKEVAQGHECGIKLEGGPLVQIGDVLEVFAVEQLPVMFNGRKYEF